MIFAKVVGTIALNVTEHKLHFLPYILAPQADAKEGGF